MFDPISLVNLVHRQLGGVRVLPRSLCKDPHTVESLAKLGIRRTSALIASLLRFLRSYRIANLLHLQASHYVHLVLRQRIVHARAL